MKCIINITLYVHVKKGDTGEWMITGGVECFCRDVCFGRDVYVAVHQTSVPRGQVRLRAGSP